MNPKDLSHPEGMACPQVKQDAKVMSVNVVENWV
jgi:hypothetical protein